MLNSNIHIVSSANQNSKGGGITVMIDILEAFKKYDNVSFHISSFAQRLWESVDFGKIKVVIHKGWKTWDNKSKMFYDGSERDFNFDQIDDNSTVFFESAECVQQLTMTLKKKKCKIVWQLNSPEHLFRRHPKRMIKDFKRIQKIDKLICVSNYVKKVFEHDIIYKLFSKKLSLSVVYNGTTLAPSKVKTEEEHVIFFGRFDAYKNPLFLEKIDFSVRYIGKATGSNPVAIPDNKNLGWMTPDQAASKGDIFVFPSLNEAFGLVVIEMMSRGKICICFNSGAFPEIIDHGINGFLIEEFDFISANRLIQKLRSDNELKEKIEE